jgi:hypothetical protein
MALTTYPREKRLEKRPKASTSLALAGSGIGWRSGLICQE